MSRNVEFARINNSINEKSAQNSHIDALAMKSMALSCISKQRPNDGLLINELDDLMAALLIKQQGDGSFGGSVESTALVLQALIEAGRERHNFLWNRKAAVDFLNTVAKQRALTALEGND